MQRLIIDTNVLVAALIQKSYPYFIMNYIPAGKNIKWCISDEIQNEYSEVLRRCKFLKYRDFSVNAENLLVSIEEVTDKYATAIKLSIIKDSSDNKFLELAATCKADFLITGNTNDFTMSSFGRTKIVTPKEYWENCR